MIPVMNEVISTRLRSIWKEKETFNIIPEEFICLFIGRKDQKERT